ncbi:phosphomannomutase [Psychrobacter piscatorii]|uniref:phosphomannomutase n=1 Tax=Psychrobacter piscatorii TaxID=554343 RepID=UPI003736DFA6
MPSFAAQQSLFRAYDIRGTNTHFTDEFVQALGHRFAQLYGSQRSQFTKNSDANTAADVTCSSDSTVSVQQNTVAKTIVVIGYDMRHGSESIARTLSTVLTQQGLRVVQLGLVTTPMMAFWAKQYQGHGIIVTASHSAKDILGIKWLVNHRSPSNVEIQTLYQQLISHTHYSSKNQVEQATFSKSDLHHINISSNTGFSRTLLKELPAKQVADVYIAAIEQVFCQLTQDNQTATTKNQKTASKLDLVVVIDCMHGATGNITQRLFDRFCQHVIVLNDTPDGSFPLGNPDPAEPNRLTALQQAVISHHADIGLAFDGDGDRLMIVDNDGKVVMPDHLLYLLARIAITERPDSLTNSLASEVLFDIKCAHHLPKLLADLGAMPVISKTGSSFMRQQVQHLDSQIIFAGELSGHFIFNDGRFIPYDDAIYAALRLLHWFAKSRNILDDKNALTDILQRLPAMVSTADHYLPVPQTARTDCSIMEQLTRVCTYLQDLASVTTHADLFDSYDYRLNAVNLPTAICESPVCTCSTVRSHIAVEQAKSLLPAGTRLSCIDGVRLDFAHGFGVLRQSNTSNSLTARFAGDSMDDLKDIQATFAALCRPFNAELATQIVAMPAE